MDNNKNVFFRIERISSNCAEENRKIKREMTGHSKGHCLVCLPNSSFPNSLCKLFTRKYSELILIEKLSSSEKSIIAIPIGPLIFFKSQIMIRIKLPSQFLDIVAESKIEQGGL